MISYYHAIVGWTAHNLKRTQSTDSDMEILEMVEASIAAGGHGVSMGRNVFQHSDVRRMMGAISDIVLHGFTAKEAFQKLTEE